MKLLKKVLITIGREYGSGGKAIAEALAGKISTSKFMTRT